MCGLKCSGGCRRSVVVMVMDGVVDGAAVPSYPVTSSTPHQSFSTSTTARIRRATPVSLQQVSLSLHHDPTIDASQWFSLTEHNGHFV